jgi:LPXTG-site transpeptidase (sortase) family protein
VGSAIPLPAQAQPRNGAWLGEISIPAIHLKQAIVQGVGEAQLSEGPGHYPSTPGLGEAGNVAIAGHRTTWGHPFRYLNELRINDPIVIVTTRARLLYRVTSYSVVSPNDVAVLDPTRQPTLTLTTCTPPYSAVSRLVLRARLVAVQRLALLNSAQRRQVALSQSTFVQKSSAPGSWPVVLYGFLFAMFVLVGSKWFRDASHKVPLTLGLVIVGSVLLFHLFGAVSAQLPQGF